MWVLTGDILNIGYGHYSIRSSKAVVTPTLPRPMGNSRGFLFGINAPEHEVGPGLKHHTEAINKLTNMQACPLDPGAPLGDLKNQQGKQPPKKS